MLAHQERLKVGEANVSSAQHAELLERIHTAKLLRESNQTLRDENEANLRKATQLDVRLQQALAELDPLKEKVHALMAEIESKDNNLRLLEEDNERWKVRNQTILSNYERIDPEELQSLQDEVAALKVQLATVEAQKDDFQSKFNDAIVQVSLSNTTSDLGADTVLQADASRTRFSGLQARARDLRDELVKLRNEAAARDARDAELAQNSSVRSLPPLRRSPFADRSGLSQTQAQTDSQAKERLDAQATAFAQEKTALEARLAEEKLAIEARVAEEKQALEARLAEESSQRLAQAVLLEKQAAELAATTAEKLVSY